jgi:hypothetical protein
MVTDSQLEKFSEKLLALVSMDKEEGPRWGHARLPSV